jgi:hypothetical protein
MIVSWMSPRRQPQGGAGNNSARDRVRPASLLNIAGKNRDHAYGPLLTVSERVVRLIGRDIGFAAPVTFSGEQDPGALGLGQLAAAAELPEVQVRASARCRS